MSIDDVVTINISAETKTPSQKGFGTPLIMAYHTIAGPLVRTYTSLTAMVTDGFSLLSGAYLAAVAIKSQTPSPTQWKIGKRSTAYNQQIELTVNDATQGKIRTVSVRAPDSTGAVNTVTYTVPGSATTTTVASALAQALCGPSGPTGGTGPTGATGPAAMTGLTGPYGVVAKATTNKVIVSTTGSGAAYVAGLLADIRDVDSGISIKNITLDSGIATDLAACAAEDDDFYGVLLDSNGAAEVAAAAAAVEAMPCIFAFDTADTGCTDATSTTDIGSTLAALKYARTVGCFNSKRVLSWLAASAMGGRLPDAPGSSTWCHKSYAGVPVDKLSGTAITQLKNRKMNYYTSLAGNGNFFWGTSFSGDFIDITIFCDWLKARMGERIVGKLQNSKKIPFTDNGINTIVNEAMAQLTAGVQVGGLVAGTTSVTAPKAADVSAADKGTRTLPNVTFTGQLAGAIHKVSIAGTVTL